jgi:2-oxoglutarate ferredoxin oxidoreductase subunit gamma
MKEQIIIAGSGGQGVLTLGIFIARVAVYENKNAAWLPSYGAEKRGGFSFCSLVISDEEIFSPVVETADTLIAFDQRALDSYVQRTSKKTLVIENSSLILHDNINADKKILIPASDMAKNLDASKVANIIMAGAYIGIRKLFSQESARVVIQDMLGSKAGKLIEKNLSAFEQGFDFAGK